MKKEGKIKLYSPNEVGEMIGVQGPTVIKYLRRKKLRGYKIGGQWKITEEDLKDFIFRNPNK